MIFHYFNIIELYSKVCVHINLVYIIEYYCINILHNVCLEIIVMSSLTKQLFNSGYDK